jgi:cell division protein FtsN
MARDYKNSKRSKSSLSGWGGLLAGLALGLAVAAAIYVHDRRPGALAGAQTAPIANEQAGRKTAKANPTPQSAEGDTQFDFYEVLPKFEVVVPDKQGSSGGSAAGAIDVPGSYILQVGSYRNFADADHVRAQLALQGVESKIQKVSIDNDTWHRVRIGPISNLNKLEETRRKLREAQVDALVIKTGNQP